MVDNAKTTGAAVEAHFQFLMWLMPTVEKFPRTQKFLLGDRIQTTALDVLEALIEATYTRDRKEQLNRNNNIGFRLARTSFAGAARITIPTGAHLTFRAVHDEHGRGPEQTSDPIKRRGGPLDTAAVPVLRDSSVPMFRNTDIG